MFGERRWSDWQISTLDCQEFLTLTALRERPADLRDPSKRFFNFYKLVNVSILT